MTLVLTVNGIESVWMLTDRRLSSVHRSGKILAREEGGCKLFILDATDAHALIGYAGLGRTPGGMQPSDWMSNLFRGRRLTIEQALSVLCKATKEQFARIFAADVNPGSHVFLVTCWQGEVPRLFGVFATKGSVEKRRLRSVRSDGTEGTPRVVTGGSGSHVIERMRGWKRELIRLVNAYDRSRVSPTIVADYLARLCVEVSSRDESVGPNCVIAVRNRPNHAQKWGNTHWCYANGIQDSANCRVPFIMQGLDLRAVADVIMPSFEAAADPFFNGGEMGEIDDVEVNRRLSEMPRLPDDRLR